MGLYSNLFEGGCRGGKIGKEILGRIRNFAKKIPSLGDILPNLGGLGENLASRGGIF